MFGVGDRVFEEFGFVFGEVGEADFGADFLTPETIDAGIDGDACDPVVERLVGAERVDVGEDLEEDILSDVLFVGGAWEVGADDADDVRVEGLDERACCGFAAVADEGDEAVPVRRGRGIRVQHEGIWDWRRMAAELVTDRNAEKRSGEEGAASGEDAFDGFAGVDPGEAGVEALEFDGEAGVIDACEVEHGGVEVVHGDDVED